MQLKKLITSVNENENEEELKKVSIFVNGLQKRKCKNKVYAVSFITRNLTKKILVKLTEIVFVAIKFN